LLVIQLQFTAQHCSALHPSYSWEGIRQVRATLLCARHVPERLCGGRVYLGRYIKCSTLPSPFLLLSSFTKLSLQLITKSVRLHLTRMPSCSLSLKNPRDAKACEKLLKFDV